ncbi:MAG: Ig-like domain-containing protein, partial [Eubacteriales bacterium]|nr:Ig-like domain-containing protein [Eubacteriales bacterium]
KMKKFGKIVWLCLLVLLCIGGITANAEGQVKKGKAVKLVQTQTVKAKWKGRTGTITWSSSDETVAKVSQNGTIKAVAPGKCRITAENAGDTYYFKVKVQALAFQKQEVTLIRYRQYKFTLNNNKAGRKWKSSDPRVASVDHQGVVTANAAGECMITAKYKGVQCSAKVKVLNISLNNLQMAYTPTVGEEERIVLAGSSSVDFWKTAAQAFAPYEIVNTAIAGTTVLQWQQWYPSLITQYHPSAVVLYVGSNDIANGRISGEQNATETIKLLNGIRRSLPKVPIYYVSITPCYSRQGGWNAIAVSNTLVDIYCDSMENMYFVDLASRISKEDGTPDASYFLSDALHPNEKGYAVWKKLVAKPVVKMLNKAKKIKKAK